MPKKLKKLKLKSRRKKCVVFFGFKPFPVSFFLQKIGQIQIKVNEQRNNFN
jgi:hypothetical protein